MISDIAFLKRKLDAGANGAITQFFYNPDAYFYFLDACAAAGIAQPIYPGIMPILNHDNLARFARNCGAEIPRWLHYRLESFSSDEAGMREFCDAFLADFCQRLLAGGAPGLHFFAMNRSEPGLSICRALGFG